MGAFLQKIFWSDPHVFEHLVKLGQGQADNGEVTALNAADEHGGGTLYSVGARLVHGLSGIDIAPDFRIGERFERNLRGIVAKLDVAVGEHRQACVYRMGAAGKFF